MCVRIENTTNFQGLKFALLLIFSLLFRSFALCSFAHLLFALSLICSSPFCSFALCSFAHLLFALLLKIALRSLQKRNRERFAQVTRDKRATGAIHSLSWANHSLALSLTKNEWIARKTDERIPNPANFTTKNNSVQKATTSQLSIKFSPIGNWCKFYW